MIARTMLLDRNISNNIDNFSEIHPSPWNPSPNYAHNRIYPFYLLDKMTDVAKNKKSDGNNKLRPSTEGGASKTFNEAESVSEKLKNGPAFIWMSGRETLASSSSLTDSQVTTDSTDSSSSIWSYSQPKPPKMIKVSNPLEPISLPYAQLCFDPESKTLVTLMEINLAGNSRRSKRLRIIDPLEQENFPSGTLQMTCDSGTESTVSTRSIDPDEELNKYDDPIVLSSQSQEVWLEETDLDLYLLHECEDPWEVEARGGCAETLKKILIASRSLIVFKQRDSRWEPARESFSGIGYSMLEDS
jgi:hypothetical protein